jgi:Homeodomain-like domain
MPWYLTRVANGSNVKKAVKAAVLRQEIVKLSLAGWSNEDIAAHKGISQQTVINHYHKFLESSKYPVADVDQVHIMRQEQRVQIEANQRLLVKHIDKLHHLVPADNREECEISAAICKCQDSYIRSSDHFGTVQAAVPQHGSSPRPEVRPGGRAGGSQRPSTHATPRLRIRSRKPGHRYSGHSRISRTQQHSAYSPIHGSFTEPVCELLLRLTLEARHEPNGPE